MTTKNTFERYQEDLFLYSLTPDPSFAVALFVYEYNLYPKDEFDIVFIEAPYLKECFIKYLKKLGISTNFNLRRIFYIFSIKGVQRLRSRDRKNTFYKISRNHLLKDLE